MHDSAQNARVLKIIPTETNKQQDGQKVLIVLQNTFCNLFMHDWDQNERMFEEKWPIFGHLCLLVCTLCTFWAETCMIGMLGSQYWQSSDSWPCLRCLLAFSARFWLNHKWLGCWEVFWKKIRRHWTPWCFLVTFEMLFGTLMAFCSQSWMIRFG